MTILLAAQLVLTLQAPAISDGPWIDNNRQFKSDDPKLAVRRSEHFRIVWGQGLGEGAVAGDYGRVTEQLVQSNLQYLEKIWSFYHGKLGFHMPYQSSNPAQRDGKNYRGTLVLHNTGIWEGGAWGTCDEWGIPLFAMSPPFLQTDPPSTATPHEYAHTVWINAAGFNDTPYDGMWHEAMANWSALQHINSYPNPGGVGTTPYLSQPHGRNYYDAWALFENLREDKRYGLPFMSKLWLQAKGKDKEYIFDAIARLIPYGETDPKNAVKDLLGTMARKAVTWDYERGVYFRQSSPRDGDFFKDIYRRGYTELERSGPIWRCPLEQAPEQGGYNIVPIELAGKKGGSYPVTVDLRPFWDPARGSDFRATLVAVNDNGEPRYSPTWNQGRNSITLFADENKLYLVVAATPDLWPFNGFEQPKPSEPTLQPQAYEVAFVNTQAKPFESKPVPPSDIKGHKHTNGGGFVADSSTVDPSAYVGPNAMVLDSAQVREKARIEGSACIRGNAVIRGKAVVSDHAMVRDRAEVYGSAKVRDWATVGGSWKVFENGRALEHAFLSDRGQLHGNATIQGVAADFGNPDVKGYAIKDGDCSNGASVDKQFLTCWVWGTDQKYADAQPDTGGLLVRYAFDAHIANYAKDSIGLSHGFLRNGAFVQKCDDPKRGSVLSLDGEKQYVELRRRSLDLRDATIALWAKNNSGKPGEHVFYFSDGGDRYAYLVNSDSKSKQMEFVISDGGKAKEQKIVAKALPYAKWTHLAVTLENGSGSLCVDGKLAGTNPKMTLKWDAVVAPNLLSYAPKLYLGKGFTGLMDDFRIYVQPQQASVIAGLAADFTDRTASSSSDGPILVPPTPAFLQKPVFANGAVTMSAKRINDDAKWIEYRFARNDKLSSGWISTNRWVDPQVQPGKKYVYSIQRRDRHGNVSKTVSAFVETPLVKAAVPDGAFAEKPIGISDKAIRMKAIPAGGMEFRFKREDGKVSGWQSSPVHIDRGLVAGSEHSYAVEVRNGALVGKPSAPSKAFTRDDAPPARYPLGEWQTRPMATVDNELLMRAMSVIGGFGLPRIEDGEVEYSFECAKGGGPNSGWIKEPFFKTGPLKDGIYEYRFKIRDLSPQKNETGWSTVEEGSVTTFSGYHPYELNELSKLEEGTLVSFEGKVDKADDGFYIVSNGSSSMKVVPQTKGFKTDPAMVGKTVKIRGGIWIVSGEKRVTWAEMK